jgi:hypothetical protein
MNDKRHADAHAWAHLDCLVLFEVSRNMLVISELKYSKYPNPPQGKNADLPSVGHVDAYRLA